MFRFLVIVPPYVPPYVSPYIPRIFPFRMSPLRVSLTMFLCTSPLRVSLCASPPFVSSLYGSFLYMSFFVLNDRRALYLMDCPDCQIQGGYG